MGGKISKLVNKSLEDAGKNPGVTGPILNTIEAGVHSGIDHGMESSVQPAIDEIGAKASELLATATKSGDDFIVKATAVGDGFNLGLKETAKEFQEDLKATFLLVGSVAAFGLFTYQALKFAARAEKKRIKEAAKAKKKKEKEEEKKKKKEEEDDAKAQKEEERRRSW